MHEPHKLQQEFQCMYIPVKAVLQVSILHLQQAGAL
jgi:hypothetical protein